MDLKDKLARLGSAPPGGADRDGVLSGLRERMAEIIGREPAAPVRVEPSSADLGFLREEREDGTIYRSFRRLLPSHHVGRLPVDAARVADAELISLLALDARLLGCRFERALFLDTETTGLGGGAGVLAFLVGLSFFDEDGHACLEQLLLRRPVDEPALLRWVAERVAAADLVITYNGKSFDLPLLASRMVMNRMPPLPERPHLDLLHVARRLHQRRLGACRLTTLEGAVLGFERGPDVAGSEMAARYAHFLRTGEEAALSGVVEHNAWDVLSMMALVGLYGEPLDLLVSQDLVGLSRTLRRARALDRAHQAAEAAVARGGGALALRARAEIRKARGERALALADFETLLGDVDEDSIRLELVKLYEHHVKEPLKALGLLARGTGEGEAATERRRARLVRKAERNQR